MSTVDLQLVVTATAEVTTAAEKLRMLRDLADGIRAHAVTPSLREVAAAIINIIETGAP